MEWKAREQAIGTITQVLPHRSHDLARLLELAEGGEPTVTVVGKYNHGKSRLLNELIGRDEFSVADKRETVDLHDSVQDGVRWLDAPGLDADVGCEDDQHALQAAWLESDIRLFVHAAKEGELDASELALLDELHADQVRTQRQNVCVLSQIDQLADEAQLRGIADAIVAQTRGIAFHEVSATRHRQGAEGNKRLLLERSGIPALKTVLDAAIARVPQARAHEATLLSAEIREELRVLLATQEALLAKLRHKYAQDYLDFEAGLRAVIAKVGSGIEAMLDALGPEVAHKPDEARDHYNLTAGKIERNHLQNAYSRACIEIDAFLTGHGVIGLPKAQQTGVRAMDSVMVAVMGVFVKFRKDLRRMFCEEPGRNKMQREFTGYFEASNDRVALAESIAQAENSLAAIKKAQAAMRILESGE